MKIEHTAYQIEDVPAMAEWYCNHMGFTIKRSADHPVSVRFLADGSGQVMFEIYNNPSVKTPDYKNISPAIHHIAFVCENVQTTTDKLVAAGATVVEAPSVFSNGDEMAMLRDPFGLAIQLAKRAEPMV